MKSIGQTLKDARIKKRLSLKNLEEITKIKSYFIDLIEQERWNSLPPFPTVLGFVKSISGVIDVDEKTATAILKRDYPPKKLSINPKPDVYSKFSWSPKLTFILGIGAFLLIVLGYLGFQYYKFISPPMLKVLSPQEGQEISEGFIKVFGTTDSDSKLVINGQPVIVDDNGKFSIDLEVVLETKEVTIESISRSGKTTTISRKIVIK